MFIQFKKDVEAAFKHMITDKLYIVDVAKDELWDVYLNSFTDPVERQDHNCNNCRSFIRHMGKAVAIDPETFEIKTFWDDVHTPGYQLTAKALAGAVKSHFVSGRFMLDMAEDHGCDHNVQILEDGTHRTWHHLYVDIPQHLRYNSARRSLATLIGDINASKDVLYRSVRELKLSAIDTVIDLIEDGALYRGQENLKNLQNFRQLIAKGELMQNPNNFCWFHSDNPVCRLRNTALGTLLVDLSEGKDLEVAVKAYENIMAPANYKRPKALITKKQIEAAQKTVEELGLTDALPRRHAAIEDISVNDVLFVNRDTRSKMKDSIFQTLEKEGVGVKNIHPSATVSLKKFLSDILPNSINVEFLVENIHIPNLVTLTAPVNSDADRLFKWTNNFAWVYNGSVADSFREKVKKAGGNIEGFLRASLHWFNYDDLDIHCKEPNGSHIYFGNKRSIRTDGTLDVDMNAGKGSSRDAVENIVWTDRSKLRNGTYIVYINQFHKRESVDFGFEVEIELDGNLYKFNYKDIMRTGTNIDVARIIVDNGKITVEPILNCSESSNPKDIWNIKTMQFVPVSCIMKSPNYWGDNHVGNEHVFFMLKDCMNPDPIRGFFNEYLRSDLEKNHRRVFEAIGSKAKVEFDEHQLSGLGFSTTKEAEFTIKVDNIIYKVKI